MTYRTASAIWSMLAVSAFSGCAGSGDSRATHEPVVADLVELLDARPDLRDALTAAIDSAAVAGIPDLPGFYGYVDELVTWIPIERELVPRALGVHYVVNQAPGDALNQDPAFSDWLGEVAEAWGAFLDTPASAAGIESFTALPDYNVDDYHPGPSGWRTFNQFFAREIKPGKRPIDAPSDDAVIVSPADAIFMGAWPIDENATVTLKGAEWAIADLLDGSPYADAFSNGIYAHTFLRITDYHRYHLPVSGVVKEVRNVHGRVYIDVVRNEDGSLGGANGDTYQFNQERGLVIIDSPTAGLVALVPVGMSFISSVALEPEVGARLRKGDEFGYFQFGGSDIVMLFQDRNIILEAEAGTRYLQGERIGRVGG
ncbi:MAG: phosphatidylserine decarboxylase family protein [Gemmatimonadota bacterium]|nr:phosphatidylserine decarboxylase family protein [Gemmatimonadota bacterium]MDH5760939.1 phosphatidylserine decarboxylase family protein [Gemmatimonadota bacterium]